MEDHFAWINKFEKDNKALLGGCRVSVREHNERIKEEYRWSQNEGKIDCGGKRKILQL